MSSEMDQEKSHSPGTEEPCSTVDINQIQNDNIDKSLKAINSYQSGSNGDSRGGNTITNESEDHKSHSEELSTGKPSSIEESGQVLSEIHNVQELNSKDSIATKTNNEDVKSEDDKTFKEDSSKNEGSLPALGNKASESDEILPQKTETSANSPDNRSVESGKTIKEETENLQVNTEECDKSNEREVPDTFITNLPDQDYTDQTAKEFGSKDSALDNSDQKSKEDPKDSGQSDKQAENTSQWDDFYDDPKQNTVLSENSEKVDKETVPETNSNVTESQGNKRSEYLITGQQSNTDVPDGNTEDVLNEEEVINSAEQKEGQQKQEAKPDKEENSEKSAKKLENNEEPNVSQESKTETKEEKNRSSKSSFDLEAEGDTYSSISSTKQDDTLADVDPLVTITETPVKPEKADGTEPEMTKSEVEKSADDDARADEVPKPVINDDTDNEADDLKSEEVSQVKENMNEKEDVINCGTEDPKDDDQDVSKEVSDVEKESPRTNNDQEKVNDDEEKGENINNDEEKVENAEEDDKQVVSNRASKEEDDKKVAPDSTSKEEDNIPENEETSVTGETVEGPIEPPREPTPEPEPVKIARNIEIDNAVTIIKETESGLKNLYSDMKELLTNYQEKLNSETLSDFTKDLDRFRGDFASLKDAFRHSEELFNYFNKNLKEIRMLGDSLNSLIQKKFRMEDLTVWLESPEDRTEEKDALMEERIAVEKSAMAKAAEARAAIARAAVGVTESSLFAAEIEAEAAEAEAVSKRAWETAQNAKRDVEEAEKAAVEKRKAEEEARKRAEERAQKKAEEERLRQEEENKRLKEEAEKKGTSFEDEKQRFLEEKAKKEAERKDPKNWPRYIYSVETSSIEAGVPGCVIRAIEGSLARDDITVKAVDQLTGILNLVENEELISHIVSITPTDPEKKFQFEEPVSVAIPHCLQRNIPGREPVIKQLQPTGKWTELPTNDIVIDDMREMKFVEIRVRRFGVFAVVLRIKRDTLTFLRRGNKVNSTVDARISFTCKPGMFKNNVCFTSEVQTLDVSTVTELNKRYPKECGSLLSSSPILRFQIPNRKFAKPLTFTLPLPPNSTKLKRPQSVAPGSLNKDKTEQREQAAARPLSSIGFSMKEDEPEEETHLLVRDDRGPWVIQPNVDLIQPKNKDIVTFEIKEPNDRFLILRTKQGVSPLSVEKMASHVERAIHHRSMQVILRQRSDDPNEVVIVCCPSSRAAKTIKILGEEGFDEGPAPSKDIIVKEGQILDILFRGNIQCDSGNKTSVVFNTFIRGRTEFSVEEIDKFAQKSSPYYRGFAQVFTKIMVQKPSVGADKSKTPQKAAAVEWVEEEVLLSELLINIPKPEPEPPKPLATAPIKVTAEGPNKEDILQYVASELGDEWKKLAQFLSLKSVRIQAILRQNNQNPEPKKIRYDMLVTWAKRVPRCLNKLEILAQALSACGRGDLAIDLRERDEEFRRRRAVAFRESYLRRAFVKVAQNPEAVKGWKTIATRLGVPETEVTEIDQSAPSVQQKCFSSLQRWQRSAGDEATLPILSEKLRVCRFKQLARDIESIA